ncbi:MAG: ATP-binding cassette domain-containing protein [Chloroflexi bacterium]|nr:ATP-binding cassette domain-containing protein [Chloroflexota bacterium]
MRETVLRLERLTKDYGSLRAVDNVTLEVFAGECFGFLGPNGAGKTTTIGMILGLLYPTSGRVVVLGEEVTPTRNAALRAVGALVGAPGFYPYLSARENLRLLARVMPEVDTARVDEVLAFVGLDPSAARRAVKTYSTGMKQRLGLAAALLHRPRLLILDEPTNGLDPIGMAEMRQRLRMLVEQGVTVFLSSHLLHEVEQICDRVAILNHGRIVAQGAVTTLLANHRDLEDVFIAVVGEQGERRM